MESAEHTFRCTLLPVRLHRHVCIEVVQGAICLLTALPPTFIHALDFFIAATRSLVLLSAGDWDEGIYLGQWVRLLVNRLSTMDRYGKNAVVLT